MIVAYLSKNWICSMYNHLYQKLNQNIELNTSYYDEVGVVLEVGDGIVTISG